MLRIVSIALLLGLMPLTLAGQDTPEPPAPSPPSQTPQTPAVAQRPEWPLLDAIGRAADPPVCCQLTNACSPGTPGTTPAELRSLCMAAHGQPLTGQYCHSDGACRP